jgi:hypothetical protein
MARPYRFARRSTAAGLAGIGVIGLANSWGSLYSAASVHMAGTGLPDVTVGGRTFSTAGLSLPLLLDVLIAVASSRYVIGVLEGRAVGGWRAAAHAAIAGTVLMNALAAHRWGDVPWHVVAPAVLSLVIELVAREILGTLREITDVRVDVIPLRLWITCPAESVRVAWRMARTGQRSADEVRRQTERCAAVRDDLCLAMPGPRRWRDRTRILRRLWSGALDPDTLTGIIVTHETDPRALLRACLRAVACPMPHEARGIEARALKGTDPLGHEGMPQEVGHEGMGMPEARALRGMGHEGMEACPTDGASGHEASDRPDEARAPEACPTVPGPATEAPGAHPRTPRTAKVTLDDIAEALADGTLTALSRNPLKARFDLRSNSTADRLIKAYREREEQTTRLRAIK